MNPSVRRAAAFALVGTLALAAPAAGTLVAVPFALIAVVGRVVSEGRVFELFARPGDHEAGALRGLIGFSLAATALALLFSLTGLPVTVFVATVLVVGYGNLAERLACRRDEAAIRRALGFSVGGALAATAGLAAIGATGGAAVDAPLAALLGAVGGLVAALVRAVLPERDDPLVMATAAASLWVLAALEVMVDPARIAVAVAVAGSFGYLSWYTDTASVTGMLTGVLISLLTIVLGGYGWFAVLITFFGVGGLAAKFRYEEKDDRGVAEGNEGARGASNVLGNAAVALAAVVGFAGATDGLGVAPALFTFAFAGSLATALSDTLSSEIGVLFGQPRLVTSFEAVEAGTDGGVTLEGSLAGLGGAAVIGGLASALLGIGAVGAALVAVTGLVGMFADSLLGATVEGGRIGNQSVNFLATLSGGLVGALGALALGLV